MNETLLTVAEAALALNVSPAWVYRATSQRKLPFVRVGTKSLRFRKSDLLEWLDERTTRPAVTVASA